MSFTTGIYHQILTSSLKRKLSELPVDFFHVEKTNLDRAEAAHFLAQYLERILQVALKEFEKRENSLSAQIDFCNELLQHIDKAVELDINDSILALEGQLLVAILSKIGKTDHQLKDEIARKLPLSGLSVSSLFTGSNSDISIDTEIERDILSADRIYWIVSFIRWSGLRIFEKALKEFTERSGAQFRIITTSYMGATEARALDFLNTLPKTQVKISYHTQLERLHAKAYIFERNTQFDTAYIGSSNLSRSALTKGLEWNLRVTSQENPHIIEKAKATFDHYWNSIDFEDFKEGGIERFKKALQIEKNRGASAISLFDYFQIHPFPFQKEILDRLSTERKIHNRFKNLIVAATGTGKTVISAFDYKRVFNAKNGKATLLFVAHRKEILEQAQKTFRSVLGTSQRDFGQLWVGNHEPKEGDLSHLFISIQTFNSKKEFFKERLPIDFYDFIIIDEAHHSQADTYRAIFEYFQPEILLGLTATPERMDGRSLLPDFCDKIAAEIRLPDALNMKLLAPFQYFCISDESVDLRGVKWSLGRYDIVELTTRLSSKERINLIIQAIEHYLADPFEVRALCFCTSKDHAQFMSEALSKAGYRAKFLISGNGNEAERDQIRQELTSGKINFLCVVDIFNEGVDIPEIDAVLFLRPTESLTVFLQQLGRGLRIAPEKECLTVLDFVSQAHVKYNFSEKFRALVGKTNQNIEKEIEKGFPHLPPGCTIRMERTAKEYILQNIRNAVFNLRRLRREIANYQHDTDKELTISNFLAFHHLDIRSLYSNRNYWSGLKRDVGVCTFEEGDYHSQIASGLRRLISIDSISYLQFIKQLHEANFEIYLKSPKEEKFALMFYYDIWQKGIGHFGFESIFQGIKQISNYPVLVQEIFEIIDYLIEEVSHSTKIIELHFPCPLELHAQYSRDQILCAFGKSTPERPFPSQEGVINIPEQQTELLLVTLNKSDKDFSPSIQYEDYAISETIFHWQSQNKTAPDTPTGRSYIKQRETGKTVLLFVREEKKDTFGFTSPYHYLGPVDFISHRGSKPMSINWELREPMPAYLWKAAAKMAVG
jgi:superfamily II DNA or RNA helicase